MTSNVGNRRTLTAWMVSTLVAALILGLAGVITYYAYQERDQVYWSRLYLARSEINAIETAAESFHKEYGNYPRDLQELVRPVRDNGTQRPFLTKIAPSPWGGSFGYEVEHGQTGEGIRIWAVPDRKTQDRLRISELTNRTDWQAILKP